MNRSVSLLLVLLFAGCGADPIDDNTDDPAFDYPSLKALAPYGVGVAFKSELIPFVDHRENVVYTFDQLTAEWEMKMNPMSVGPNQYDWDGADALVAFATANGMKVHGHALLWHSTVPAWLENFAGTDTQFEDAVRTYITTVVQRYKDSVVSWDVVNEAFEDNSGALRNSVFRRRMGPDYIAKVFAFAHDADPDALLLYNDYGLTWDAAKRSAAFQMVDDLQSRGVPIHGVGLQMHITYSFPAMSDIVSTMNEIVQRDLQVHISELDIRINPDGDLSAPTSAREAAQRVRTRQVIEAFNALPSDKRFAVTVWGVRHSESWLIDFWGNPEWPLLFDDNFVPGPAHNGFVDAL
ncbi:MAG: cellulase family glycosylhydrolase [Rhodothermales bacterium]|nr:cellulase family glycosylhydrolase [Rhodothermales bacterium]